MTETKRPRGRPRPAETVERDRAILAYLKEHGPQSRNDLAMALLLDKTVTYLALTRLRNQGKVELKSAQGGPGALWTLMGKKG
jgi:predicted ArsR family transcriptional regulator